MKNGKSPGIDGLPIEFYKVQYEMITNNLLQLKFHSFPKRKLNSLNESTNYYPNTKKTKKRNS